MENYDIRAGCEMKAELRKEWYSRPDVLSNIIPCITCREVSFMLPFSLRKESGNYPVRCIKAHHSTYLRNNMEKFNFFDREYNLYHSIFVLKDMPMFSYHAMKRKEQQILFFKHYDSYVENVDFVIDIDGDKTLPLLARIGKAKEQAIKITSTLSDYNIPYCIMFSGSKGFHIEVRDFPPTREWNKRIASFQKIATLLVLTANGFSPQLAMVELERDDLQEVLKTLYSFDSSIYDVTRIWKCPYSYDTASDMIVMPLSSEELINFSPENYTVEKQLLENHWYKGLKKRKGNINNFWLMAKAFGVSE